MKMMEIHKYIHYIRKNNLYNENKKAYYKERRLYQSLFGRRLTCEVTVNPLGIKINRYQKYSI